MLEMVHGNRADLFEQESHSLCRFYRMAWHPATRHIWVRFVVKASFAIKQLFMGATAGQIGKSPTPPLFGMSHDVGI
jgi:hypothetical protein